MKTKEQIERDKKGIYLRGVEDGTLAERQRILEIIGDIDIELIFTDVKDTKGSIFSHSNEIMKIIELWWEVKSKDLKAQIQGDKNGN